MLERTLDRSCAPKKITMKERSSATGPKRSGGTKRRTKLTAGSVIANINSATPRTMP